MTFQAKPSPLETICMECQTLFPGKIKKNISKCLLKILLRVLSVKSTIALRLQRYVTSDS